MSPQGDRAFPTRSLDGRKVEQGRRKALPQAGRSMITAKREAAIQPWSAFPGRAESEQLAGTRANSLESPVHSAGVGHRDHLGRHSQMGDPVFTARPEPTRLSLGRPEEDRR